MADENHDENHVAFISKITDLINELNQDEDLDMDITLVDDLNEGENRVNKNLSDPLTFSIRRLVNQFKEAKKQLQQNIDQNDDVRKRNDLMKFKDEQIASLLSALGKDMINVDDDTIVKTSFCLKTLCKCANCNADIMLSRISDETINM